MAKKRKMRSLPKRIAGVKVPKALRQYADTPLGASIIAQVAVTACREVLASPAVQNAVADVRDSLTRAGAAVAVGVQHAIDRGRTPNRADASDDATARRRRRLEAEDSETAH